MELMDTIRNRRSIRKFTPEPVTEEHIDEMLEAARLAPSGSNTQPWRFVVIRSDSVKKRLESVTPYKFAVRAPVVIACCADSTALQKRDQRIKELLNTGAFADVDMEDPNSPQYKGSLGEAISIAGYLAMNVAIAVEHMILRATELGLGTCWIGRFDPEQTRQILELADSLQVISLLPVGYPAQAPAHRPRLAREEILLKTV